MGSFSIVGLEHDAEGALDARVVERLRAADRVLTASADAAVVESLAAHGIEYVTLADIGISPHAHLTDALRMVPQSDAGDTVIAVPTAGQPHADDFDELVRIIAVLRAPDGCPWDREQTHKTLGKHLIEEAYEALAAIESGDEGALADELGDVLLQIVLHAQIGAEDGYFTIEDVVASIVSKIRRRHPHVFGDANAETAADVIRHWDAIKRGENAASGALGVVPHTLPALMLAQKISRRAAGAGFDWEDVDGVWEKVHEEIDELKRVDARSDEAADEVGDLLFSVVNVARKLGVDAESALRGTCAKFVRRFSDMEAASAEDGRSLDELDLAAWEELWRQAKRREPAATDGSAE